jgi:hypothetical protein
MGQNAPLHANDAPGADALAWARVARLVALRADGSWTLAAQYLPGTLEFRGQVHPFAVDIPCRRRQNRPDLRALAY